MLGRLSPRREGKCSVPTAIRESLRDNSCKTTLAKIPTHSSLGYLQFGEQVFPGIPTQIMH